MTPSTVPSFMDMALLLVMTVDMKDVNNLFADRHRAEPAPTNPSYCDSGDSLKIKASLAVTTYCKQGKSILLAMLRQASA
jgi:hypothetical protein